MVKDPKNPTLDEEHIKGLADRLRGASNQKHAGHSEAARKVLRGVRDELNGILQGWEKGKDSRVSQSHRASSFTTLAR
jgi:hypothetical protein